ncbi:hypothetical protein D9M70_544430 [compost metagenome]
MCTAIAYDRKEKAVFVIREDYASPVQVVFKMRAIFAEYLKLNITKPTTLVLTRSLISIHVAAKDKFTSSDCKCLA